MALQFYMTLEGEAQGKIEGSNNMAGHDNEVLCHAFNHSIDIPYNRIDGQPTGKRIHGPMTITKSFDKSSPKLYQALSTGERMKNVTLKFFRILPDGTEENYFTIILTKATLVQVHAYMYNVFDSDKDRFEHMEDVAFTYGQIEWRWEPDSISAEDRPINA